MPLPFRLVCNLLQAVENDSTGNNDGNAARHVGQWFRQHRSLIDSSDGPGLLSTLIPTKRTDRVYSIQAPRLERIVGRVLNLGGSRKTELGRYKTPGSGVDLGDCVESILLQTPNPDYGLAVELTVEEIDKFLHAVASNCRFSSPAVKQNPVDINIDKALADLYQRPSPRDAKWLTRLILKDFRPAILEPNVIYRSFNPLIPKILLVRDNISEALSLLKLLPNIRLSSAVRASLLDHIKPKMGVKVGRQVWQKGRSIKHCIQMGHGKMSVEQKMDGEYCQIHVDLAKSNPIQIFSKSGKNSTQDRVGLHEAITHSLLNGEAESPIRQSCIVEGELLVYNNKERKILDFHHIRKHVTRSGTFMHTEQDSMPSLEEHLMIVYYDALMLDETSLLDKPQSERFQRLKGIVHVVEGHSHLVEREVVDFSKSHAASQLRDVFSRCIISRGEGLVLKPDEPYFDFNWPQTRPYSSCCIKLKKEYIGSFGDVGDFAVVAAYFDPVKAKMFKTPVKWTHFFIACLENKDQYRSLADARFAAVNVVELNEMNHQSLVYSAPGTSPYSPQSSPNLRIEYGVFAGKKPHVVFQIPMVFDIRCFSFDKQGNTGFWTPRFPQVSKIHFDRSWEDTITFNELQEIAKEEKSAPEFQDSQETRDWVHALENADPGSPVVVRHVSESQQTRTTEITVSTPRSICSSLQITSSPAVAFARTLFSSQTPESRDRTSFLPTARSGNPNAGKRIREENKPDYPRKQSRNAESIVLSSVARLPLGDLTRIEHPPKVLRVPGITSFSTPKVSSPKRLNPYILAPSTSLPSLSRTLSAPITLIQKHQSPVTEEVPQEVPRHICTICREQCRFFACFVILSPDITTNPRLINFLKQHSVKEIIGDSDQSRAVSAIQAAFKPENNDPSVQTQRSKGGGKLRTFCLVDSRQKDETKDFLTAIGDLNLRTRSGKRQWISCYDWRLVEDAKTIENRNGQGGDASGYDPWRKWHVGLA